MVTGCFSSETAVSSLMETSDNGCPNRTTLSNNLVLLEIKMPAYERKLTVSRGFEVAFHFKELSLQSTLLSFVSMARNQPK